MKFSGSEQQEPQRDVSPHTRMKEAERDQSAQSTCLLDQICIAPPGLAPSTTGEGLSWIQIWGPRLLVAQVAIHALDEASSHRTANSLHSTKQCLLRAYYVPGTGQWLGLGARMRQTLDHPYQELHT